MTNWRQWSDARAVAYLYNLAESCEVKSALSRVGIDLAFLERHVACARSWLVILRPVGGVDPVGVGFKQVLFVRHISTDRTLENATPE